MTPINHGTDAVEALVNLPRPAGLGARATGAL